MQDMAKKKRSAPFASAHAAQRLREAATRLVEIGERVQQGDATRRDLDDVIGELRATAVREFGPRPPARRGEGGKLKILGYLKKHLGERVHGEELAAISGASEWARRARELRTQEGYDIEEIGGYYRLNDAEPNEEIAERWQTANEIRKRPGSAMSRLLALLQAQENQIVTGEELDYVANVREGSRRVRELRDEQGWPIETHHDDPRMQPGQYRLASAAEEDRLDVRQRAYPNDLRERIFERDNYTCQACGRNRAGAEKEGDLRFYLEVHHKQSVAEDSDSVPPEALNDEDNLITLCHRDHVKETARLQKRRRAARRQQR